MKTATIRQVRHDFGTVLDWVGEGEQVEISKRGKIVALLSPPACGQAAPRPQVSRPRRALQGRSRAARP